MERDALISHGAAFVVRDRLLACSDICSADLCSTCGSMLTSQRIAPSPTATTLQQVKCDALHPKFSFHQMQSSCPALASSDHFRQRVTCRYCGTGAGVVSVTIPYVLRYLASELAAMNIKPVSQRCLCHASPSPFTAPSPPLPLPNFLFPAPRA